MDPIKKGTHINAQPRQLIYKVYLYFVNEKSGFNHLEDGYFYNVIDRVVDATGVSKKVVIEVLDGKDKLNKLKNANTPPKRKRRKILNRNFDNKEINYIRNMIYSIQLKSKEAFSLTILQESLVESELCEVSKAALKKIIKEMGFRDMKIHSSDKIRLLVEKPKRRLNRLHYIRDMQEKRKAGGNIVYLGETYVRYIANYELKSKERMIIMHAGNENGFIPGALMISTCVDSDDDYDKELNNKFQHWIRDQLVPTLPPNSVLVIEDIPRHNEILMKTNRPYAHSQKQVFMTWLSENTSQPIDPSLTKPELYNLVCERYKRNVLPYALDNMLKDYGHTIIRLPKYHTDFNPINKLWVDLRGYINENIKGLRTTKIESVIEEKIKTMGKEEWSRACQEVMKLEDAYLVFEQEFDKYTDNFVLTEAVSEFELSEAETSGKDSD